MLSGCAATDLKLIKSKGVGYNLSTFALMNLCDAQSDQFILKCPSVHFFIYVCWALSLENIDHRWMTEIEQQQQWNKMNEVTPNTVVIFNKNQNFSK